MRLDRYTIVEPTPGKFLFAYSEKAHKDYSSKPPPHWICPACFAEERLSVLSVEGEARTGELEWWCPAGKCSFSVYIEPDIKPTLA